jgi:hypothetical protein
MKTFGKVKYCGYVTEYDTLKTNNNLQYQICYSDGDREDVTEAEFQALKANKDAVCNKLQHTTWEGYTIDTSHWVFPLRLARLYARLSSPYDLDAMESPTGESRKAQYFCSRINSVYNYELSGMAVWCNPDFAQIKEFLRHFLRDYDKAQDKTELTLVVPFWPDKPFWPLLRRFRLIDAFPPGALLFEAPGRDFASNNASLRGPTRWPTLVLYLGSKFSGQRLFKATKKLQCEHN